LIERRIGNDDESSILFERLSMRSVNNDEGEVSERTEHLMKLPLINTVTITVENSDSR
jgi:hypothetical protein